MRRRSVTLTRSKYARSVGARAWGWYHGQQSSPNMYVFANFGECPVEPAVKVVPTPLLRRRGRCDNYDPRMRQSPKEVLS